MADGLFVVLRVVLEVDRGIDPDERGLALPLHDAERLHRGADRPRLAGVRVDEDLGAGDALLDVIDLRFDRGQVVLRAPLKDELRPERRHARDLNDVLPDVLREDLRETREHLFLREALLLEVHPVGIEEDRAAVAELRRELRLERDVGELGHGDAERVARRLKEHAVAGRAAVRETEVRDVAVLHEQDLDVLPADVADDVDVAEEVHRAHHVRDGLDDVHVGANALFEDVGRVAGGAEAHDLELRPLLLDPFAELREELFGVGDRVPARELVGLREDLPVVPRDEDGLRRRRAAIEPDDRLDDLPLGELLRLELRDLVDALELVELVLVLRERRTGRLAEARLAPVRHVLVEAGERRVELSDVRFFVQAVHHRAERRVVLRVLGDEDGLLDRHVLRVGVAALVPRLRDPEAPALLEERQVRVRSAEEEDLVLERAPAREDAEVLKDDRVGERAEDLLRRDPALDQVDDVRLGEDAALGGDVVKLRVVEVEARHHLRRGVHLQEALVDRGAGARRALVVHGGVGGLFARLAVRLEHDDLRVLPAELDDRADVRVQVLDRERDRVDLLDELPPRRRAQRTGAGAGEEHPPAAGRMVGEGGKNRLEHRLDVLGLLRMVPLVVAPEDLLGGRVYDDGFDRRAANVHPYRETAWAAVRPHHYPLGW